MRLTTVYLRFFRSFNYDYERRAMPSPDRPEWETVDGQERPFIRIPIEDDVTAIVGANESGKTHLIVAAIQALTGDDIDRGDFCRYSQLFSVEEDGLRNPDLGVEVAIEAHDFDQLDSAPGELKAGDRLVLLRVGGGPPAFHTPSGDPLELSDADQAEVLARLPVPKTIDTHVAIPDTVSYSALRGEAPGPLGTRSRRRRLGEVLTGLADTDGITAKVSDILSAISYEPANSDEEEIAAQQAIARKLLFDVARIDSQRVEDLEHAIRDDKEGQAKALEGQMNQALSRRLNFARVWRQDAEFELLIDAHEHGISFTVHDRTGRSYSFDERSTGLRYFLSYYVQLLAMDLPDDRTAVLLVDEPDAYLSGEGQQDLLQILEDFTRPHDKPRHDQVVYVTHSPFLINRNAGHRIRVLDKGTNDQGTRVVKDVAQTHYEPLRSALGDHVAETAFIGGSNLVVEGLADQVLLAGLSSRLRRIKANPLSELLDLNQVTIVPAGSAASVPYIVYLARGRDELKPACVALLDGDQAGKDAVKRLKRADVGKKELLADDFILQLGDWAGREEIELKASEGVEVTETDDLIPVEIAVHAVRTSAERILGVSEEAAKQLDADTIKAALPNHNGNLWDSLEDVFAATFDGAELPKVAFARETISYLNGLALNSSASGVKELEHNFRLLLRELAARLGEADRQEGDRRRAAELYRLVREFGADYPQRLTKDEANQALRRIDSGLERGDPGDEAVRAEVARLRQEFKLGQQPSDEVDDFSEFARRVEALPVIRRSGAQRDATR
jgi:predicted ATP-dependent endonuclease of OLD family